MGSRVALGYYFPTGLLSKVVHYIGSRVALGYYFPTGLLSKVVHYIGSRVAFGTQPEVLCHHRYVLVILAHVFFVGLWRLDVSTLLH
jgi:hypothetical protein